MTNDTERGCCTTCSGTGYGGPGSGPETNGRCWDCRGAGCAHDGPCAAKWSDLHLHPEADGMRPCFATHADDAGVSR